MSNSNTEHSRKLRSKTAAAATKRKVESGEVKIVTMQLSGDLASRLRQFKDAAGTWEESISKLLQNYCEENDTSI